MIEHGILKGWYGFYMLFQLLEHGKHFTKKHQATVSLPQFVLN